MTVPSVHWHEGMFLWPQQMQQAERFVSEQVFLQDKWDIHYNWGLRSLALDPDALGNFRFAVRELRARLRDGALVAVPDDVPLPALDLKEALERSRSVMVLLAVPHLRWGKVNVAARSLEASPAAVGAEDADDLGETRLVLEMQDLEDENSGEERQPIQVRLLNAKLLLSTQNAAGYETLPLARVQKSAGPDGKPELDIAYIPPVLACDAWKPLHDGILQAVYDRFGGKVAKLAAQIVTRGITFDSGHAGDALLLAQLRSLNQAYAVLKVTAFADGVHPLQAYLELCRLAGKMAIFNRTLPRAPALPRYDHDDLGGCFYRVKHYLDSIDIAEPIYEERPFIGEVLRMQVVLEPKWLEPSWQMYVGVHSPLKAEDCIRMLTKSGELDMKIGSAARVDEIFEGGRRGLKFTPQASPPRALPSVSDLVYFQVSRESQEAEWEQVQKSLTLAIRLNKQRIAGNIQGQRTLTIKSGAQTTTMGFTLYLTPREA